MQLCRRNCNLLTTATLTIIRGSFRRPLHLLHFLKLPAKVCQAMSTRGQLKRFAARFSQLRTCALHTRAHSRNALGVCFERRAADQRAMQVDGSGPRDVTALVRDS